MVDVARVLDARFACVERHAHAADRILDLAMRRVILSLCAVVVPGVFVMMCVHGATPVPRVDVDRVAFLDLRAAPRSNRCRGPFSKPPLCYAIRCLAIPLAPAPGSKPADAADAAS